MRFERVRKNCVVYNKINGQRYMIEDINKEEKTANLLPYVEDDEKEETIFDLPVTMTEKNAICFRLLNDPNKPEIPEGYSVNDGVLTKEGEPVTEQGALKFKGILCVQPGYLVLKAETRDHKEDRQDLFTYDPWKDTFRKIAGDLPETLNHYLGYTWEDGIKEDGNDFDIYTYFGSHTEDIKDEEGNVEQKEKFDESGILVIHDGTMNDIFMETIHEVVGDGPMNLADAYASIVNTPEGLNVRFKAGRDVDDEGFMKAEPEKQNLILKLTRGEKDKTAIRGARIYAVDNVDRLVYSFLRGNEGLVIFGDSKIIAEGLEMDLPADVYKAIADTEAVHLVDVRHGQYETEIVLATRDGSKVLNVLQKMTRDRGAVTKLV